MADDSQQVPPRTHAAPADPYAVGYVDGLSDGLSSRSRRSKREGSDVLAALLIVGVFVYFALKLHEAEKLAQKGDA